MQKKTQTMSSPGLPCPSRLHGQACAQIPRGFAELGVFKCTDCLLRKSNPNATPPYPEGARKAAESQMALALTTGADNTGKGFHDYKNLELEYIASLGFLSGGAITPSEDHHVFMMFLTWLTTSKERALSLDTVWRAAGSVKQRTRGHNFTKVPDVKAHYEMLRHAHGEESDE